MFDAVWADTIQPMINAAVSNPPSGPEATLEYGAAGIKSGIDSLLGAKDKSAQQLAANLNTAVNATIAAGPGGGNAAANEALAKSMMPSWSSGSEWANWQALWTQESGWNQFAQNPSSGAYGIPQALPFTKMPVAAWPPPAGSSNPRAQIGWGIQYIQGRYGDPIGAEAHERAYNWYAGGGPLASGIIPAPMIIKDLAPDSPNVHLHDDTPSNAGLGDLWMNPVTGLEMFGHKGWQPYALPSGYASGGITGVAGAWTQYGPQIMGAIRGEETPMYTMHGAHLPPGPQPTMPQRWGYTAWQNALWNQQLKTFGLGRNPPGAFDVLNTAGNTDPSHIPASDWTNYLSQLSTLVKWEEGPGAGGVIPPAGSGGTYQPNGWAAWKYLNSDWTALYDALHSVQTVSNTAYAAWNSDPALKYPVAPGAGNVSGSGPGTPAADILGMIHGGPGAAVYDRAAGMALGGLVPATSWGWAM